MSAPATQAVFLSYASQDGEAALRIMAALRGAGVEVWFDQNELGGGDAWDNKIRRQIAECALFVPVISAATQARLEGYFRIEWKLAAQRTHAMAEAKPFLLPVVIDATRDAEAHVPAEFRAVQWTLLPGGEAPEKFCARVKALLDGSVVEPGRPHPGERGEGAASPGAPKVGRALRARLGLAAVVLLAVVAGVLLTRKDDPAARRSAPSIAENAAQKSVAVLAFKNLSGDPAREFFSDGLSEAVTDVLGRVPGLKVVGSASAFSFKGKPTSIPEIARQLGVTHLVEGTVIQDGPMVRITAKLTQADGFQVWVSDKLEREAKNIFALHDEVSGLIAKNLSLKLEASSAASTAPVNPQAFELYVQARQAWNLRTAAGYELAESLLTRALALEPNFARAHAELAHVWLLRRSEIRPASGESEQVGRAVQARITAKITQALTLDPDSAEAHATLGLSRTLFGRNSEAEPSLRRAVALNPNYASARQWLGRCLLVLAHMTKALEQLKLATELDPLSPTIWFNYGLGLSSEGRQTEAIAAFDRALTFQANFQLALGGKISALVELGNFPDALSLAQSRPSGSSPSTSFAFNIFARTGQVAEAEALLAARRSSGGIDSRWAEGLLALGRADEAMALLLDTRDVSINTTTNRLWSPIYDPVRNVRAG